MVVYGKDMLDEISLSAPTKVCEIKDGWLKLYGGAEKAVLFHLPVTAKRRDVSHISPRRVEKPPSARQTPPIRGRWRLRQRGSGAPKERRERPLP